MYKGSVGEKRKRVERRGGKRVEEWRRGRGRWKWLSCGGHLARVDTSLVGSVAPGKSVGKARTDNDHRVANATATIATIATPPLSPRHLPSLSFVSLARLLLPIRSVLVVVVYLSIPLARGVGNPSTLVAMGSSSNPSRSARKTNIRLIVEISTRVESVREERKERN